jgi:predicted Zn finger-like uncharacterized protein
MRLTCPNCAAQYEVPSEAIPATGRDVQCSACGHGWFERPAGDEPRLSDPDPLGGAPWVEDDEEEADDLAELRAAPLVSPDPVPEAPPPQVPLVEPSSFRPRVAPEVERILREEAGREAQVRAEEAARRVMPDTVGETERSSLRRLRPLEDEDGPLLREAPPPSARPAARPARQVDRELDLDRINSTLRSHGDQLGAGASRPERALRRRRRGGGFLGGFLGTLLVLAVLAAAYVWREDIEAVVPQAAVVLDPYARAVDQGRAWLDGELARLLGPTGGSPEDTPRP